MRTSFIGWMVVAALGSIACGDGGSDDAGDEGSGDDAMAMDDGAGSSESGGPDGGDDLPTPQPPPPSGDDDGSSGGGDDGGSESGDTGSAGELSCDSYCSIYMSACVDYSEYANMQDCMDNCGQWPIGTTDDTATDSLGCRLYHATVASAAEPEVHCPHAAPNGDGTCVSPGAPTCEEYCDTYFDNCTEDLNAYTDMLDCLEQCEPWYQGTRADTAGNTVGCRMYHGGAPALGAPDEHCPHAGPGGGGICAFL